MLSGVVWACVLVLLGVFSAGSDVMSVSVKEGDSVTLHNDFKITNQHKIRWYFKDTRIAEIDLYNGKSCTDVQCKEGTEGFRGRLKLDHQTGSLTIINSRSTDSGEYKLEVISKKDDGGKTFSVTVYSVSAADKHEMEKDQEGESDTSNAGRSAPAVPGMYVAAAVLLVICAGLILSSKRHVQSGNEAREHIE